MPQGNLAFTLRGLANTAFGPGYVDGTGKSQLVATGGAYSILNITAPGLIKIGPCRLSKLIIIAPGTTSGAFILNDVATLGGAAAANEFFNLAYNATANLSGAIFNFDWPIANGLVLSAIPGAGSPIIAVSLTY